MRITIESIATKAVQHIGYTRIPGYPVQFSSLDIKGGALFVPKTANVEGCVGQSFYVEIGQERVTNLERVAHEGNAEAVVALSEFGAFCVCGTVTSVVPLDEPEGNQVVTIAAGEAVFTLCQEDLGSVKLVQGEKVAFVAHEVSLWDEAI